MTGTPYNSYPAVVQKSSMSESRSPADVQTSNKLLFQQPVKQSSGSLSTPRGLHSSLQETRDVSATRGRNHFFRVESQSNSQPTLAKNHIDISVSQHNLNLDKSPSSITRLSSTIVDLSPGINPRTISEGLQPKIVHSYLFKDPQNSLDAAWTAAGGGQLPLGGLRGGTMAPPKTRTSEAQVYGTFDSGFEELHKKDPMKENHVRPVHLKTSVPRTAGQRHSSRIPPDPGLGEDKPEERSPPNPQYTSMKNNVTSNEKHVTRKPVNTSVTRSRFGFRLEGFPKIYGIKGFTNPLRSTTLSSKGRNNSSQNSFPFLLPKYAFGRTRSSTTLFPEKLKLTPSSDQIQTLTIPSPRLFSAGSKKVQLLVPESDTTVNQNLDQRQVKRLFGTRPLEGAKTSLTEPDRSPAHEQGFGVRSTETWQPRSTQIYRWYNKTREPQPGSGNISTERQNELNSKDFNPLLKSEGSSKSLEKSRFTPSKFEKNPNIHSFRGFTPVHSRIQKSGWKFTEENPNNTISPPHLSSAEGFRETKPVPERSGLFNRASSDLERGKHNESNNMDKSTLQTSESANADMVPLPKQPVRVTYADVVGSATFVGVRSRTQTPIKPRDNVFPPESTKPQSRHISWAIKVHDGGNSKENTSSSAEAKSADEEEDLEVKQPSSGFGRRMKTLDDFMDNEGSGSGAFNLPDVSSAERTKSQGLSGDLLELDYLHRSTENVSFKSVRQESVEA